MKGNCAEGYPEKACPFGFTGQVKRATCGGGGDVAPCKHFIPPPHILAWCMLYDRDGVICHKPKSACDTCPEKLPDEKRQPGRRVVDSPVDWKDPESVRAYWRERAKLYPDARAAAMLKFLEKDPDYFKRWAKDNKDKIKKNQAAYYQRKKAKREQSQGQVQRDPQRPRSERDKDLPAAGPDDVGGSGSS